MKKEEQKQHITDIMKQDEELEMYKMGTTEFNNLASACFGGKPKQWYNESKTDERMNVIGQNGNDGEHYECETLEESLQFPLIIENGIDYLNFSRKIFNNGAKWQQERSYSEEEMKSFADWCRNGLLNTEYSVDRLKEHLEQWKQFKKK